MRVNNRYPERLVYRLGEVDAIVAVAAKKEGLVFLDRTSHFEAGLEHSYQGLRRILRIGKKLIRVQRFIAQKQEAGAVELTRSGSCGNGDRRAAVSSFFGSGVICRDLVLLHVIRCEAVEVADRVGS